jgi:hypothetical protein
VKRCSKIITFSFKKFLIKIETLQFSNFYVRPAAKKERKLIESYKNIRLSLVDGKKKRRQKLIGKQNPKKKKKKIELDNFQFNYFNEKDTFVVSYNRPFEDISIDEDRTVVEFVSENEEVGDIDILKALWNMKRSNMSITIFFTYNFFIVDFVIPK